MKNSIPISVELAFEKIRHTIQRFGSELHVVGGWRIIMSTHIHYGANVVENR